MFLHATGVPSDDVVKSRWIFDCSDKTQFYVLTTVLLCANTNEKGWTREFPAALVRQQSPSQRLYICPGRIH